MHLVRTLKDILLGRSKKRYFYRLTTPVYHNRHVGRDFIILTTGPTLGTYRDAIRWFLLSYPMVSIGVNFLDGLCVPTYHLFANRKRFCTFAHTVKVPTRLLLPPSFPKRMIRQVIGNHPYEYVMYDGPYFAERGKLDVDAKGIVHLDGGTAATVAIGVAIAMGAKNIYCAGLDGFSHYDPDNIHFFKDADSIPFDRRLMQERCTEAILHDADQALYDTGGNVRIITPTVYKWFYDRGVLP